MQVTFRGIQLVYLFGDVDTTAGFVGRSDTSSKFFLETPSITYDDILWCLRSKMISIAKLEELMTKDESVVYRTFLFTAVTSMVYDGIPGATINVNCLNRPCLQTSLATNVFRVFPKYSRRHRTGDIFEPNMLDLEMAIGTVAFFEGHDISQSQLVNVMAIST
jgi:hypothetical protein